MNTIEIGNEYNYYNSRTNEITPVILIGKNDRHVTLFNTFTKGQIKVLMQDFINNVK